MRNRYRPPKPQRWRKPPRSAAFPRSSALHRVPPRGLLRAAILFGFVGALLFSSLQLRPTLRAISAHQANLACTRAITSAVEEQLSQSGLRYENLVSLSRNLEGGVTAVETDMVTAGRLKTAVTSRILDAFQAGDLQEARIPLGTLTGSVWLNGRGPSIPLKILPSRVVSVDIESQLIEAGINQTLHQLLLTVEADAEAILPGLSSSTHVSTRFLLAETVIVGEVPGAYTAIQGAPELSGQIADYGASLPSSPSSPEISY
ncbi:MAG: sporulation protein YunB [Provencibacterium sp.]|jgi:sporulation protein YunB|nr:sporulation protein YunB [Provencibacterium sp.]